MTNCKKIVNDPVHGFIGINSQLIFDLIEHPYFQRLRNIKQLALGYLVYPGAVHTRLQHALGAMYLLNSAIDVLRSKGHEVTQAEAEAAAAAILLHDIGHGPFSHALEFSIAQNVEHEDISRCFMIRLNNVLQNKLNLAIDIFNNHYHKHFLHQLISSQIDMDRLDYLKRDSFFTGVVEGAIGSDRIIKMLNVVDDELVVEAKGIYSVEKFLIARRLMYWQVYLHKTVVAAEQTLVMMLKRAKILTEQGINLNCTPALKYFLRNNLTLNDFISSANRNDIKKEKTEPSSILSKNKSEKLYQKINQNYSTKNSDICNQNSLNKNDNNFENDLFSDFNNIVDGNDLVNKMSTNSQTLGNCALDYFAQLDDADIQVAAKLWLSHDDVILSTLANMVINRRLPSVELKNSPFDAERINSLKEKFCDLHPQLAADVDYFVFSNSISNKTYQPGNESIRILYNNGHLVDIAEASDILSAKALSNELTKYFICYPKELR